MRAEAYQQPFGDSNTNTITVGNYAHIVTKGDNSEGIRAGTVTINSSSPSYQRVGSINNTVTAGANAYIETQGMDSINNTVTVGTNAYIETQGMGSIGLYANNGTIELGSGAIITTGKETSHGVQSSGSRGNITLGNGATIATNGVNDTLSVYATSAGTVTLNGGAILNAGTHATGSYALYATGSSHIDGGAASVYRVNGDIYATSDGRIDLNMGAGSVWTGAAYLDSAITANTITASTGTTYLGGMGMTHITMADSVWNMTGDSQITSLNLQNGTVAFQSSMNDFHTLSTGSLSGSGIFAMKVNMESLQGDLLNVTSTNVAGNHKLVIANTGSANTDGTEALTVVQTLDNYEGVFTSNAVEAGAYEYQLRQAANGTDWELFSGGARKQTTTADASVNLLNANYLLSYIDTQTLLQRMGQLRDSGNQQGDFWIRGFTGKLDSFGGSSVSGFDMSYQGTQAGIDGLIDMADGRLYVGAMAGFTDGDPDYRGGHGTTKDYHFGVYGTRITDSGLYVDGVFKYTHMKNRFSVKDSLGDTVSGKGSADGYSASVEVGKRFDLPGNRQAGSYFVEPQMQMTYGYQSGMSINASNGLKTKLSSYNYALGRIGTLLGYTIQGTNPVDIYIKTGYVREFDGKTSYRFNQGGKISHSFKGGWWDNGIGINARIAGQHNIYADIEYATGSRFDQKQFNAGYRYSF